jgi:hypothetical protein
MNIVHVTIPQARMINAIDSENSWVEISPKKRRTAEVLEKKGFFEVHRDVSGKICMVRKIRDCPVWYKRQDITKAINFD